MIKWMALGPLSSAMADHVRHAREKSLYFIIISH
jgi:hypothetical protein